MDPHYQRARKWRGWTDSLGVDLDPQQFDLQRRWFREQVAVRRRFVTFPGALPPAMFLLDLYTVVYISSIVLGLLGNVYVWRMTLSFPDRRGLTRIGVLATVLEWGVGIAVVGRFKDTILELIPFVFAPLILVTGMRFGWIGLGSACAGSLIGLSAVMAIHSGVDVTMVAWICFLGIVALLAASQIIVEDQVVRWERIQWGRTAVLSRRLESGLSNREYSLLCLLADPSRTYRDIGVVLCISPETVKTHVRHIGAKLGASGRRQVVVVALERGLLPLRPADAADEYRGTTRWDRSAHG